jgi:hypothetical protein
MTPELRSLNYTLSPEQLILAEKIGRSRCNAKNIDIRFHDSDYHSYNGDRAFPHIIGVKAEIAYAALTGQEVNTSFYSDHGDKSDFGIIEIKSTALMGDGVELLVKVSEYHRKKPQLYILARVIDDTVP